jgi:hypothetical protein
MKEDKETGLGYGPFKVKDRVFEPFGRVHDYGYTAGSESQESMTREEFDEQTVYNFGEHLARAEYLRDLTRKQKARAWIEYQVRRARLFFYYRLVQIFGRYLWEGKKDENGNK